MFVESAMMPGWDLVTLGQRNSLHWWGHPWAGVENLSEKPVMSFSNLNRSFCMVEISRRFILKRSEYQRVLGLLTLASNEPSGNYMAIAIQNTLATTQQHSSWKVHSHTWECEKKTIKLSNIKWNQYSPIKSELLIRSKWRLFPSDPGAQLKSSPAVSFRITGWRASLRRFLRNINHNMRVVTMSTQPGGSYVLPETQ